MKNKSKDGHGGLQEETGHTFVPRTLWKEYPLLLSLAPFLRPRMVGKWTEYGIWPLILCIYEGDEEPTLPEERFLWPRLLVWDRIKRKDGEGKRRWLPLGRKRILHGSLSVIDATYDKNWPDNTKYKKNKWLKRDSLFYTKESVSYEEFVTVYSLSQTYQRIDKESRKRIVSYIRKRGMKGNLERKHYLLKDKDTGKVCAGMSYESSPSTHNSHYAIGFISDYKEKRPLMLGLIVDWIEEERIRGYTQFQLGVFWKKGYPESWKGYSEFKKQFKPTMIDLPPSLVRVKWFW